MTGAQPDGENLQYPEILLRDLHLVQVDVAPGQRRPHEVAVGGTDRRERLAVVPGGPGARPLSSPAVRTERGREREGLILIPWWCFIEINSLVFVGYFV